MKQHITIEQLNELSEEGKEKLEAWFKETYGYEIVKERALMAKDSCSLCGLPFYTMSIGQMIEFLEHHGLDWTLITNEAEEISDIIGQFVSDMNEKTNPFGLVVNRSKIELCDALWEAVKEQLV